MTSGQTSHARGRSFDDSLYTQIDERLEKSFYENNHSPSFLPEGELATIFTKKGVELELTKNFTPQVYDFISENATKVFAILVRTKWAKAILDFEKFGVDDACLPLALDEIDAGGNRKKRYELVSGSISKSSEQSTALSNLWGSDCKWASRGKQSATEFCEEQWKFLAPQFSDTSQHRHFHHKAILPFIRPDGEKVDEKPSTFSTVYKTWIHSAHQQFPSTVCDPPDLLHCPLSLPSPHGLLSESLLTTYVRQRQWLSRS